MEFIQKAEDFVRQMVYSLSFDPEPVYQGKKGIYNMMIPPDEFFKICSTYKIDYVFKPEIKIIELKSLMEKENISPLDAIKIVKNYVDHYWVMNEVNIPDYFLKKIASIVKKDEGSDKRVREEQANYTNYCKSTRQKHFENLLKELGFTAEIANELGFPLWLEMKNLSALKPKNDTNEKKDGIRSDVALYFELRKKEIEKKIRKRQKKYPDFMPELGTQADFIELTERFFKQFHSILGVEPKLVLEYENYPYEHRVPKKMEDRKKLIIKHHADPNYNLVAEILRIKNSMEVENVLEEDALDLFKECRRKHWFVGSCEMVAVDDIIRNEHELFLSSFLKKGETEKNPDLIQEIIDESFDEWCEKYTNLRSRNYEKLIRGIKNQPILDETDKDPEPKYIFNIDRTGKRTELKETLMKEAFIEYDSKEWYERANKDRGKAKLRQKPESKEEIAKEISEKDKQTNEKYKKESANDFTSKNKFNDKSYEFILDHFKKGLVDGDREYISESKLREWIEEAFLQYPNPPKEKYSFKNTKGKKMFIKDVFFRFYDICGAWGDSKKYASLCGNYFEGYDTKSVEATWHKYKNTRKRK